MRTAILVIGIVLSINAQAVDNPFIGTWASADGTRELAVGAVDANRFVSGWYCVRAPAVHVVTDFHGDGSAWGHRRGASISPEPLWRGSATWTSACRRDPGKTTCNSPCAAPNAGSNTRCSEAKPPTLHAGARIVPLVAGPGPDAQPAPGPTVADVLSQSPLDRDPFVGTWVGRLDHRSRHRVERHLRHEWPRARPLLQFLAKRLARHRHGLDRCRGHPRDRATGDTLRFARKDRRLHFVVDGPDRLTYVRTPAEGRPTETTLVAIPPPGLRVARAGTAGTAVGEAPRSRSSFSRSAATTGADRQGGA